MNRIDQTFQNLKQAHKKAFIAFLTAGDPDLQATEKLIPAFEQAGVDIIEVGVPFSDPIADGPVIQAASKRSLDRGTTLKKILAMVERIRKKTDLPITFMMYYNQVFHFGEEKFINACANAGVDGLIIPDLPPEEAQNLIQHAKKKDIATVFFVAPTTQDQRIRKIAESATGFIYYVSFTGVTGAKTSLPAQVARHVKRIKMCTDKPVCVGFGVSKPEHVRALSREANGIIVGSAIVQKVHETKGNVKKVSRFVEELVKSLNTSDKS